MTQVYNLLDDDGIFVLQVAGIRPTWQYEDLIWFAFSLLSLHLHPNNQGSLCCRGLFMNKYVFPGADASCALNWVIAQVEGVGFEVKSVDVLGVHCRLRFLLPGPKVFVSDAVQLLIDSATLWRWYENWVSNEAKIVAKYGKKWYRVRLWLLPLSPSYECTQISFLSFRPGSTSSLPPPSLLGSLSPPLRWLPSFSSFIPLTLHPSHSQSRISLRLPDCPPQELERFPSCRGSSVPH